MVNSWKRGFGRGFDVLFKKMFDVVEVLVVVFFGLILEVLVIEL